MTSVSKKSSTVAILCLYCLILAPLVGSQDPSLKVAEILRGLGSPEWDDRKRAVGEIKVDLKLLDEQEVQKALLDTCRNLFNGYSCDPQRSHQA